MNYLLDTSVFLWALAAPERLNRQARHLLSSEKQDLVLSAASSWEISIKHALGRLQLPESPATYIPIWIRRWGLRALEITHQHALAAGELPFHHQDPFDRVLIAQAQMEQLVLLTADRVFERYPVEIVWCRR
ncbi:MAG TPA: type II toxin-antitoxin system VapC family toxin [Candidatus Acidoferrales bacterium]